MRYPIPNDRWEEYTLFWRGLSISRPIDEPLLSPRRLLMAIRMWFYLAIVMELDMSYGLWHFIRWHGRPFAQERHFSRYRLPHSPL